ncbi:VOC family protein [Nocardioides sp. KIGAM211]|uniref:VOC family protein n=1 Tax=Nocardioides luti TaxID=2761101 RepID=A0A7X0RIP8_9ACTN|nr:VOC family protein [Nocardioides luti]MBB6629079.1 VOC family protein [Nocardioides luti]
MGLRWYSTVLDCRDVVAQGRWWAETLGWQVVHASDDEVVLVPAHVTPELVRDTPWEQVGPGLVLVPVAEGKQVKNRLHLDLAPHTSDDRDALVAGLVARGATLAQVGQPVDAPWTVLLDPEGNEFCVLSSRER